MPSGRQQLQASQVKKARIFFTVWKGAMLQIRLGQNRSLDEK